MFLPLSKYPRLLLLSTVEAIKVIENMGYEGVINDITPIPHIEYTTDDMLIYHDGYDIWTNIQMAYIVNNMHIC